MKETNKTSAVQDPSSYDFCLPTGISILDVIWGGGLPSERMVELHSEPGIDLTRIALQLASLRVRCGDHVAYIDVDRSVTKDLEHECIWGGRKQRNGRWGNFDIFCPPTFRQAEWLFETIYDSEPGYSLIIIDSLSSLQEYPNCTPADSAEQPGNSDHQASLRRHTVAYWRSILEVVTIGFSMLVLNQVGTNSPQATPPVSSQCPSEMDGLFDIRTAIASGDRVTALGFDDSRSIIPDLVAWNTEDYRGSLGPVVPLVRADNGAIDGISSVATFLVQRGFIERSGEVVRVPGVQVSVEERDRLRCWVGANFKEAYGLAERLAAR